MSPVRTPLARRRRVTGMSGAAAVTLLGISLSAEPGSARFYRLTLGAAGVYTAGGLASGPIPLWRPGADGPARRRSVLGAVLLGVGTFVVFYLVARFARHIPILDRAIRSILGFAHHGATGRVLLSTLANGAAEEVYFRGAVYAGARGHRPIAWSTALYALATTSTANPALVVAALVMGTLFGWQRRASGGVLASTVTHLVWSTLMLRFLPPLFPPEPD